MEKQQLIRLLECLFFVASEPLSLAHLAEISQMGKDQLNEAIKEIEEKYANSGFVLRQIAGGWQFFSVPDFLPYIEKLYRPKIQKLSRAGLETLAIIAYKQPITRQEMENIRQVSVDGVVNNLLEKSLIKEVGRRETPGKPILYGTTQEFLSFFGLSSLAQLPPLEDLLPNTQMQVAVEDADEDNPQPLEYNSLFS